MAHNDASEKKKHTDFQERLGLISVPKRATSAFGLSVTGDSGVKHKIFGRILLRFFEKNW